MPSDRKSQDKRAKASAPQRPAAASSRTPASASSRAAAGRVSPQVRRALHGEAVKHEPLLAFGRTNYLLMAGGILAAVIGFLFLSRGDISLAPILIVLGYCGLIPLGIELSRRRPAR